MSNLDPSIQRALADNRQRAAADNAAYKRQKAQQDATRRLQQTRMREQLPSIIKSARAVASLALRQNVAPANMIGKNGKVRLPFSWRRVDKFTPILAGWTLASWAVESRPRWISTSQVNSDGTYGGPGQPYFGTDTLSRSLILNNDLNLYIADSSGSVSHQVDDGEYRRKQYRASNLPGPSAEYIKDYRSTTIPPNVGNPMLVTPDTPSEYLPQVDPSTIFAALADLVRIERIR